MAKPATTFEARTAAPKSFEDYAREEHARLVAQRGGDPFNVSGLNDFDAALAGDWGGTWRNQYDAAYGAGAALGKPGPAPDLTSRLVRDARTAQLLQLQLGRGRRSMFLTGPGGAKGFGGSTLLGG